MPPPRLRTFRPWPSAQPCPGAVGNSGERGRHGGRARVDGPPLTLSPGRADCRTLAKRCPRPERA
eukprot:132018-Alexandrium_andersonii.AAC.1